MTETYLAVAGLILVAVITPGPNNFIVLEQTLEGGWRAAGPAVAGVVAGTQLLLLLTWLGVDAAVAQEPRLQRLLSYAGAGYLLWLGLRIIWRSFLQMKEEKGSSQAGFTSFGGLLLFQFLNPKSWVLVLTAVAAGGEGIPGFAGIAILGLLFFFIPSACLLLWACMGVALNRFLSVSARRRHFDRIMGGLLVLSAGMLLR